jgi:ribonuclease P protein component
VPRSAPGSTAVRARPGRLTSSADIRSVVSRRAVGGAPHVVVHARAGDPAGRAAIVAGRKVGGAVVRNRAKRRLREALRMTGLPVGVDVVVTARPGADRVAFPLLRDELADALRRAARRAAAGGGSVA